MVLSPEYFSLKDDLLAVSHDDTLIKFTDRTMMRVADLMEEKDGRYFFCMSRARVAGEGIMKSGGGFFS
jgi:hypothetical protein